MPSTEWKERIAPDEQERFARYAEIVSGIQRARDKDGKGRRGFHPSAIVGAKAQLTVLADLPTHARHGLFAQPKTYDAWVRISNGAIRPQSDHKGDVRGFAFKVLGVPGKKVIEPLADAQTQDFSMIQSQTLVFKNAAEFMWFVEANARPATLLPRMVGRFGLGRTLRIIGGLKNGVLQPISSMAALQYWSMMAIRVGPYAARYALKPVDPPLAKKERSSSPTYLREDMAARLHLGPLAWDLQLMFFESEASTPIEDTSAPWNVEPVTVARLTLLQQDIDSPEGRALEEKIEAASFNPWHALVEHRPLGDMMRARDPAYLKSTQNRKAADEP